MSAATTSFPNKKGGFTLIELLVAISVLALMVVMLSSAIGSALSTIRHSREKIGQFESARASFENLTATLSQATLNTYWDYDSPTAPTKYLRKSDLHFLIENKAGGCGQAVFFQAPLARSASAVPSGCLNAVGYWVEFSDDLKWKPGNVATSRSRYYLMQGIQPTEDLSVFKDSTADWLNPVASIPASAFPIAENVLALILWPRRPYTQDPEGTQISSDYTYDSRTGTAIQKAQLPPSVQVTMIVIDEASAIRLASGTSEPLVIKNALSGRFQDVAKYELDIDAVKTALNTARINYLILSSPVTFRGSKWSQK